MLLVSSESAEKVETRLFVVFFIDDDDVCGGMMKPVDDDGDTKPHRSFTLPQ